MLLPPKPLTRAQRDAIDAALGIAPRPIDVEALSPSEAATTASELLAKGASAPTPLTPSAPPKRGTYLVPTDVVGIAKQGELPSEVGMRITLEFPSGEIHSKELSFAHGQSFLKNLFTGQPTDVPAGSKVRAIIGNRMAMRDWAMGKPTPLTKDPAFEDQVAATRMAKVVNESVVDWNEAIHQHAQKLIRTLEERGLEQTPEEAARDIEPDDDTLEAMGGS